MARIGVEPHLKLIDLTFPLFPFCVNVPDGVRHSMRGKAAVDAGDIPNDATADWSAVNLYRKGGANTWPIAPGTFGWRVSKWNPKRLDGFNFFALHLSPQTGALSASLRLARMKPYEYSDRPPPGAGIVSIHSKAVFCDTKAIPLEVIKESWGWPVLV